MTAVAVVQNRSVVVTQEPLPGQPGRDHVHAQFPPDRHVCVRDRLLRDSVEMCRRGFGQIERRVGAHDVAAHPEKLLRLARELA